VHIGLVICIYLRLNLQPSSLSPSSYNRKISIARWLEEGGGEGERLFLQQVSDCHSRKPLNLPT
ncbi:hypothetical protein GBAR_LOCUS28924, partial [Geodia barretti]